MKQARVWTTEGFEGFRAGTFGNGGQNLYVSRAGILQRIHQYDLDQDGYVDLLFCNSQPHGEQPPAYLYRDPLGEAALTQVPSDGGWSGTVADLNDDGYDDVVIGMTNNGERSDLNAFVYYGSSDGFSERRRQLLPAPHSVSITAGDFNGDGRMDLAFLCSASRPHSDHFVRIFYQSDLGFESQRFVDTSIRGDQLSAGDLDGDGHTDLVVRSRDGDVRVFWGGPDGIDPSRSDLLPVELDTTALSPEEQHAEELYSEYNEDARPLVQVVDLSGTPHVFVARHRTVSLAPVASDRSFGAPIVFDCPQAMSAAVGDVNGDGFPDVVVACRQRFEEAECSWIYWGAEGGYDESRRTRIASLRACDVAVCDLDGDGYDDVVLCQCHTYESFTREALVYRGAADGVVPEPRRMETHDPRRVLPVFSPESETPGLFFVNHYSRKIFEVSPAIYYGGPDGFSDDRRDLVPGFGAVEAACADLNDNGFVDLVLANSSHNSRSRNPGSYVLLRGPDGYPDTSIALPTVQAHGVACADLNRDGYLDVVFGGYTDPEVRIYHGSANGFDPDNPVRIRIEHDGVAYDSAMVVYLADLNNDGWLDLVLPEILYDRSFVLWGGPDGYSMERSQAFSVLRCVSARAADLSGNGYLDLIFGGGSPSLDGPHDSFAYIYWNGPDGLREDRRTLLPANQINSMTVADFNNDGLLDLFVCSYNTGRERDTDAFLYWNRKDRGFSAADRTRLFTHSSTGCFAADFNEDGWTDLAIANHKVFGDQVAYSEVWWNGPNGFDKKNTTRLPTEGPHGMTAVAPRNIADGGPAEYYVSAPFEILPGAKVTAISWDAELGPKTRVRAQLRSASSRDGLDSAPWSGAEGAGSRLDAGHAPANDLSGWVQYRLALEAVNGGSTPRVSRVDVHYA